ncbi:unnamed protein product [Gongylonema pulchrum]|uniref:DUF384 domain-containing protein n=1 Tax=Gongylonema pulchrum TaxID=637853 RepID=A0A183EL44_9BILA|nr:unnamed protein product [Gongylonema pulchrum]
MGREKLRTKGVYALLREFDKASSVSSPVSPSSQPKEQQNSVLAQADAAISGQHSTPSRPEQRLSNSAPVKCVSENGGFVYIDSQNCSTLHALIGLLIQDGD